MYSKTKPVLAAAEHLKDLDLWVPPNIGSAHTASRVLYYVTDSHAARGAAIASHRHCVLKFSYTVLRGQPQF